MHFTITFCVQRVGIMKAIKNEHTQTQEAWLTVLFGGTWPTHPALHAANRAPQAGQTQTKLLRKAVNRFFVGLD